MALNKQGLHLQLDQGINTKFDDKDLPLGDFDVVENVSFEKNGEFNKRFGYDEIKGEQIGGTQLQTPIGVTKYKDQLLWVSRDQIYSYSQGATVFQNEGSFDAIVPKSSIVVQNGKEQSELQCAYLQGYKVFVYMEGSVHKISVVDDESGSYVLYNQNVNGSTRTGGLRIVVKDNKIILFGTDGSALSSTGVSAIQFAKFADTLTGGTSGSPNAITESDNASYYVCNPSTAAVHVRLPAASTSAAGRFYIIKDISGAASTNNITVHITGTDTVDGASSHVIASNFGSATFISRGNSVAYDVI